MSTELTNEIITKMIESNNINLIKTRKQFTFLLKGSHHDKPYCQYVQNRKRASIFTAEKKNILQGDPQRKLVFF